MGHSRQDGTSQIYHMRAWLTGTAPEDSMEFTTMFASTEGRSMEVGRQG